MVKTTGIHHYAISVEDIEATAKWYEEIFGFVIERKFDFPDSRTEIAHIISPVGIRIELLHTPNSTSSPDVGKNAFEAIANRGSKHIGLQVQNISEVASYLKSKGVRVIHEIAEVQKAGVTNFWILDNEGNQIEIAEPLE